MAFQDLREFLQLWKRSQLIRLADEIFPESYIKRFRVGIDMGPNCPWFLIENIKGISKRVAVNLHEAGPTKRLC
jgi:3-polyprenyl-4-hydroxybenzoate decarboxylase